MKEIQIGDQVWAAENLNIDRFRNGDLIPEARTHEEWHRAGIDQKPAWCYYNNDPENGAKYGRLYNWFAVYDKRGLAPEGWHIPTFKEFEILRDAVEYDGNSLKEIGQGKGPGAGTNTSGFSVHLAGYRTDDGDFNSLGVYADFWSSSEFKYFYAHDMILYFDGSFIDLDYYYREYGFSVRCIKDKPNLEK